MGSCYLQNDGPSNAEEEMIGVASLGQRGGDVPPDLGRAATTKYYANGHARKETASIIKFARHVLRIHELCILRNAEGRTPSISLLAVSSRRLGRRIFR